MELEWVQRVPQNAAHMEEIRRTAEEYGILLTVHAPYYVNLNAVDAAKRAASRQRVLAAMRMGQLAGAVSVCVHPAFYMGMRADVAYANVRRETDAILTQARREHLTINLAYETMGKPTQFGTLEEVLELSKEFGIYPCIDTAHMHARTNGKYNSAGEFREIMDIYAHSLGKKSLRHLHFHYSGIAYTTKGERKHLPLSESDAEWKAFVQVLWEYNTAGTVVCESPMMEVDTLLLQQTYEALIS